jgi:hypothetical protein
MLKKLLSVVVVTSAVAMPLSVFAQASAKDQNKLNLIRAIPVMSEAEFINNKSNISDAINFITAPSNAEAYRPNGADAVRLKVDYEVLKQAYAIFERAYNDAGSAAVAIVEQPAARNKALDDFQARLAGRTPVPYQDQEADTTINYDLNLSNIQIKRVSNWQTKVGTFVNFPGATVASLTDSHNLVIGLPVAVLTFVGGYAAIKTLINKVVGADEPDDADEDEL